MERVAFIVKIARFLERWKSHCRLTFPLPRKYQDNGLKQRRVCFGLQFQRLQCGVLETHCFGGCRNPACRVGSAHGGRGPFNSQLEQREKEQAHVLDPPQRHTPSDSKISCQPLLLECPNTSQWCHRLEANPLIHVPLWRHLTKSQLKLQNLPCDSQKNILKEVSGSY